MAKGKAAEKEKKISKQKTQKPKKKNVKKGGLVAYLKEVRQEMKRVSWPGRQEVYQSTLLVLLVVGFFIVFVGVVDQILIQIIKLVTASLTGGS
jgi:preprotein translocase subunit SecE